MGTRLSPGAVSFLMTADTMAPYARTASLLARCGSSVSPSAVMGCLRKAGALCAEEDAAAAESLFGDGVVPSAERERAELLVEASGTFFSLQHPAGGARRVELKAVVAYGGKERRGRKSARVAPLHHALVGTAGELWSQDVAAMGLRWDPSRLESVHLGGDGEPWCAALGVWLPRTGVVFHLDPFHVNRAILAALPDKRLAGRLVGLVRDSGKEAAVARCSRAARPSGWQGRRPPPRRATWKAIWAPSTCRGRRWAPWSRTASTSTARTWTRCPAGGARPGPATWGA